MKYTKLVSINGNIYTNPQDAKISVFDRGFLYGDAVYEVARSYDRVFFELDSHIERMFNSASLISFDLKKSKEQIIQEIYDLYKHIKLDEAYMRIQVTRGEGNIGLSTKNANQPNYVIYFREFEKAPDSYYTKGVKIVTSQRWRNNKKALDPNIKSGNYLNNLLAFRDATDSEAYEAIMVNSEGYVTEGTTANIQIVKDGKVISTPDQYDILIGITRRVVKQCCERLGVEFIQRGFTPQELESADEVFLTSSTKELLPVAIVNDTYVRHAPGPVTQRLAQAYKDYVREYCEKWKKKHA